MFKIKRKLIVNRPQYNGWWNGEPAVVRIVRVVVGEAPVPTWWCAKLVGQEREAVEVIYGNSVFYLDNADGSGWRKVTEGRGSPIYGHRSMPVARVFDAIDSIQQRVKEFKRDTVRP